MIFCTPKFTAMFIIKIVINRDFGLSRRYAADLFPLWSLRVKVFLFEDDKENRAVSDVEKKALSPKNVTKSTINKVIDITSVYPVKNNFSLPFWGHT